ncbi:MAG: presqualene diphosphate synthase HpnD [Bacteroidota bacterium]
MSSTVLHIDSLDGSANRRSNFYLSFLTLSPPKREAIETIYTFCRVTDDIVDETGDDGVKQQRLHQWTDELHRALNGQSRYQVLNRLTRIMARFNIPLHHVEGLLEGMEMDLTKKRYETFEELQEYCYRAASTVGLMCAEVFGYRNERTKEYAVNLGIALQLTNILRDLKQDAKRGRIYLPLEDLGRFGYSEEELLAGVYNDRFVALMQFECERARGFFRVAKAALAEEDKPLFTAARIMGNIYYLLLRRIEQAQYDVFRRRIRVSGAVKVLIVMMLRLRSKFPRDFHRYVRTELPA